MFACIVVLLQHLPAGAAKADRCWKGTETLTPSKHCSLNSLVVSSKTLGQRGNHLAYLSKHHSITISGKIECLICSQALCASSTMRENHIYNDPELKGISYPL